MNDLDAWEINEAFAAQVIGCIEAWKDAAYCKEQLNLRDIAYSEAGADPILENYRNWNITADGLLISFDPYQVAAYAAGPQTVLVPYGELQLVIDPHSPLAGFVE